ncbi:cytoplasmic polyadenylation element-binding protein 1a isoform X1 [Tachysurus fulvidraco]|uniref:cytoplasmic polyadenylation element-binding protein 1a isoform X1 n=2 Tax=Tachysurus fulvidraco TaxID=1234273 RepID=UPI000F50902B|nr:cytoplasmic polyadenylation element-binding protein 1a isoform X1 [Tachysurus fulvidraco]XP_027029041.1 cytoplasmic polyadenylation element-binding protein 1a isoform X1 [Tachysurus fulvidraco]XP_027029042.1 cytoplasmic polyadenylation element-binding protein 1a isoform X1 [Tachysurus fulvidraco]
MMSNLLMKNWSWNTNTELPEAECLAVASRMPFCSQEEQESSLGLLSVAELSLGLQSLSLPWEQPWNCTEPELPARPSSPENMLGLWPSSLTDALDTLQGFPSQNTFAGGDLLEYFPSLTRMTESLSLLNSGSSSPVDSETSPISSGSDHLTSLRISPPMKFHLFDSQKEALLPSRGQREDSISPLVPALPAVLEESLAKCWTRTAPWSRWSTQNAQDSFSIETKAQLHRQAAATNEATCTWAGQLPPRIYKNPIYSCKVFLGGVPWDVTERCLLNTFNLFGSLKVEWPDKDGKHSQCPPQGYVYLVFDLEKSVKALLQACSQRHLHPTDYLEYYYKISSKKIRCKVVQVIPWVITDSSFVCSPSLRFFPSRTVFVGALHGMLTAGDLAHIMKELFGEVVYAGLDTDKHKYPIGSGRVTFRNQKSYLKALTAAFVEIKTTKFSKKVQIDPYLDDSMCQICNCQPGPFFCRDQTCFQYYCRSCWHWHHSVDMLSSHRPLMRNQKNLNPS